MSNNHLSDEVIQSLLLEDSQSSHLASCEACKAKMEAYKELIFIISKLEPETAPFDVSEMAMQRIMVSEPKRSEEFGLIALFAFVILGSFALCFPWIKAALRNWDTFMTLFAFVTACSISIYVLADLYRQYKKKYAVIFD
jgi:hypothetical protein